MLQQCGYPQLHHARPSKWLHYTLPIITTPDKEKTSYTTTWKYKFINKNSFFSEKFLFRPLGKKTLL